MSDEARFYNYREFKISRSEGQYPSFSVELSTVERISGIKSLKLLKKMIDCYMEGKRK